MSNEVKICCSCWEYECVCDYEQYVWIDEEIADALIKMNTKGYKTFYSCAGHIEPDEGEGNLHVMDVYFTTQERLDTLPEGFAYPRGKNHKDAHHMVSYKYVNGVLRARVDKAYKPYDLEADRLHAIENLKVWADNLPVLDKKEHPYGYSEYLRTGQPKAPDYCYELKGYKTFCVEITESEYDNVQEFIFGYQGKIEEIVPHEGMLSVYYLARNDMFADDGYEYKQWLKYKR